MATSVEVREREATPRDQLFEICDPSGDTKHLWDPDNEDEVEVARALFEKLTSNKGGQRPYAAFHVKRDGTQDKSRRMTTFDPDAGRVVFIPAIAGG